PSRLSLSGIPWPGSFAPPSSADLRGSSIVSKPSTLAFSLSPLLAVLAGSDTNPAPCATAAQPSAGMGVVTELNQHHCGGCNMPCAGTCSNGMCVTGPGLDGGPGHDSGPLGACRPTCASTQRCCGTTCTNREQ